MDGPADELTELSQTLDDLFGRLEASFEAQRHFVANANELRTPIAGLQTLLEVALADPDVDTETLRSACQKALALGQHQERLVNSLLTLATSERGVEVWEPFDLARITDTVLTARGHEADDRSIHIQASLPAAPATGDPKLVELLVANLIDSALRHNTPGGNLEVSTPFRPHVGPPSPSPTPARPSRPARSTGSFNRSSKPAPSASATPTGTDSDSRSSERSPRPTTPRSPHIRGPTAGSTSP